jgi:hypothetical protein
MTAKIIIFGIIAMLGAAAASPAQDIKARGPQTEECSGFVVPFLGCIAIPT